MVNEFWRTVRTEVEISNLGNVKVSEEKIKENMPLSKLRRYNEPKFIYVRVKEYCGSYTNETKKKEIICLNTNHVFESLNAASKYFKISTSAISNCLKGRAELAGGYRWAYYTEQAL